MSPRKSTLDLIPTGNETVKDLARRIATETPGLGDLTRDQLETLAKAVVIDPLKDDLRRQADLARIDYAKERAAFIERAGRTRSANTRRAYDKALGRMEAWAEKRGIPVLEMKARDADDFMAALAGDGRAPASLRLDIAAASSFFTAMERRHERVRNPFRGTKGRPAKRRHTPTIPTEAEAEAIMAALPPDMRAAASLMYRRGLRVGALPSLSIRGERFTTRSKGHDLAGDLPKECIEAVKKAGLPLAQPFAGENADRLAHRFTYAVKKLHKAGKLSTVYSVHDLRHAYAVASYRADKDLLKLQRALGHSSLTVTEHYLGGIGEAG